jgi:hypothetical protein
MNLVDIPGNVIAAKRRCHRYVGVAIATSASPQTKQRRP